jgi:ParB/RepB/Spo0J family partition protein
MKHNPWDTHPVESIAVDRIFYDMDFNCRGEFTYQSVKELADSIVEVGRLIYPILVQPWKREPGFDFRLIVGFRRFKAITTFLRWPMIPACICEGLDDHQAYLLNFAENLERKSLNIWEEARALKHLYPKGVSLYRASKELKRSTKWVWIRLRLLKMPESIQQKAAAGLLSQANLSIIAGIEVPEEQIIATEKIIAARERGTGKRLPGLERKYKFRSKYPRGKEEINRMIERMLLAGIEGLAPRVGAWCAGNVSDDDLLAAIAAAAPKGCDSIEVET